MCVFRILTVLLLASLVALGQKGNTDDKVQQLADKIKSGSTSESMEAILAAGKSGNKHYIPFLRTIAEPEKVSYAFKSIPACAQVALAQLGDKGFLSLILSEVDSENIFLQNAGIEKLSLVGGFAAFNTFYRLLDDVKTRREIASEEEIKYARSHGYNLRKGDEILEPRSILVMEKLSRMVTDPPIAPDTTPTLDDIRLWKDWFQQHSELLR